MFISSPCGLSDFVHSERGRYNERKALTKAADMVLPAGISRILISDPTNDWKASNARRFIVSHESNPSFPPIMTAGVGNGYFPVYMVRDREGVVRKVVVLFKGKLADFHHGEVAAVAIHEGHNKVGHRTHYTTGTRP